MFRIPVSHRTFRAPLDPRERTRIVRTRTSFIRMDWIRRAFAHFPTEKRIVAYTVPRDEVVRVVALEAIASLRKSAPLIPRFDRAVRTYCGMVMGYTDQYTVVEYVYAKLRKVVDIHKQRRRTLTRDALVEAGALVFMDIRKTIVDMAKTGRVLKNPRKREENLHIEAKMVERKGLCFLVLGPPNGSGDRPILAIQTKGMYGRTTRRRFGHHQEYRNVPPSRYR